ncbi:MAG: hypothetical protein ACXV2E_05405 [Halobacteriota archaeon]
MNNQNNEQQSCTDVRYVRDNKTLAGAVCVALSKNVGRKDRKVDLIFMPEEKGAFSVRSTTELMNILAEWKVSFEERKRVFDFVADRLRMLAGEDTVA